MDKDCHIKFRFATFILFELVANHVNMFFWGDYLYLVELIKLLGLFTQGCGAYCFFKYMCALHVDQVGFLQS